MKNKIVLFVGRFQPFHLGHLEVVKKYAFDVELLKIVVGSKNKAFERKNPFTYLERAEMIRLGLEEEGIRNYEIYFLEDFGDHVKWKAELVNLVGDFDLIVSGNREVKDLFLDGGFKQDYYNEDDFRFHNLSSTMIRAAWAEVESCEGLSRSVCSYLKEIGACERLRLLND